MGHEEAVGWVGLLRDAGGWGIAVLEAGAIAVLWRQLSADRALLVELLDKKSREILEAAKDARRGGQP